MQAEPPWGVEPQTYSLRVCSGAFVGNAREGLAALVGSIFPSRSEVLTCLAITTELHQTPSNGANCVMDVLGRCPACGRAAAQSTLLTSRHL